MASSRKLQPRLIGMAAMFAGLLLAGVSGLADEIGLGTYTGVLGVLQWTGITVGAILFIMGLTIYLWTTEPRRG